MRTVVREYEPREAPGLLPLLLPAFQLLLDESTEHALHCRAELEIEGEHFEQFNSLLLPCERFPIF